MAKHWNVGSFRARSMGPRNLEYSLGFRLSVQGLGYRVHVFRGSGLV